MNWVQGEFRAVDLGDEPLNGQAFCWMYPWRPGQGEHPQYLTRLGQDPGSLPFTSQRQEQDGLEGIGGRKLDSQH